MTRRIRASLGRFAALLIAAAVIVAVLGLGLGGSEGSTEFAGPVQIVEQRGDDGHLHVLRHVVADDDGALVNHGLLTVWYDDGQVRSRGFWRGGVKHGPFQFWHPNGQLRRTLTYRNGRADGTLNEWDAAGHLTRHEHWSHGRRVD